MAHPKTKNAALLIEAAGAKEDVKKRLQHFLILATSHRPSTRHTATHRTDHWRNAENAGRVVVV